MINYSTDKYNKVYYFMRGHILLKYFNVDNFKDEHRYLDILNLTNHIYHFKTLFYINKQSQKLLTPLVAFLRCNKSNIFSFKASIKIKTSQHFKTQM